MKYTSIHTKNITDPAARGGPGRKALKQQTERLRREQRELAEALRERAVRGCYPTREELTLPRID